jgi:hypothetical protein
MIPRPSRPSPSFPIAAVLRRVIAFATSAASDAAPGMTSFRGLCSARNARLRPGR